MNRDLYWIWLKEVKAVPIKEKHKLLKLYKEPKVLYEALFGSGDRQLVGAVEAPVLEIFKQQKSLEESKVILEKCDLQQIKRLTFEDSDYPKGLKTHKSAPLILFYKGNLRLSASSVAVIGARKCSAYGKNATEKVCEDLCAQQKVINSGLALGIDGIAHGATLLLGGQTQAFVAHGLDVCYPKEHSHLMEVLIEKGAVISPFCPGEKPLKYHFQIRNELMCLCSDQMIITEAGLKSGTLNTAKFMIKLGKPLSVIPSSIFSEMGQGSNSLLGKGASAYVFKNLINNPFLDFKDPILAALSFEAKRTEVLSNLLERPLSTVEEDLFRLQLDQKVEFRSDGKWHLLG